MSSSPTGTVPSAGSIAPSSIDSAPWDAQVISLDVHLDIYHPLDRRYRRGPYRRRPDRELQPLRRALHLRRRPFISPRPGIDAFNGLDVNQEWDLWAIDLGYGDTGYIDYWWIKVYYSDPPYIYAAEVSDLSNTVDLDGDNYFEEFDFDIDIDADYPPGTTSVAAYITCITTNQTWEISPWVITGTDYDWVSVHFDETDFAGRPHRRNQSLLRNRAHRLQSHLHIRRRRQSPRRTRES